jgi:hypothetical protein
MNADSVAKSYLCPWVNATADSATGGYPAEALALANRSVSALMGVGGYFMEVPRASPVGLHFPMDDIKENGNENGNEELVPFLVDPVSSRHILFWVC